MGEITIKKALDDYKTIYMPYRNFADRTREEYQNDLEDFTKFIEQKGINRVRELGLPIVERYVSHLEVEGFSSLTRKRKVVAIRSFLSFLYQDGYTATNIAKIVVVPFIEYPSPNFLTQRECNKLRRVCSESPRDSAIIELILQTGIKLSELVRLTLDDIELNESGKTEGFIRIRGSVRNKERIVPLNSKAYEAIRRYLDVRGNSESGIFFINRFGEQLGESGVQKMLTKYLKISRIERASIHTLRHTFGTHHMARGTDPKTIQEVMGLKDFRSISIYVTLADETKKVELEKHSI